MKRTAFLQALVLAVLFVASWLILLNRFKADPAPVATPASSPASPDPKTTGTPLVATVDDTSPATPPEPPEGWRQWTAYLAGLSSAREWRWALGELGEALFSQPADATVDRIMELLESGFNLPTRLLFQVGPEGRLAGAGSLRAQLLDWLGLLDPMVAAAYARQELESMGTRLPPEEYVVHLRNFAWGTPAEVTGREAFLSQHFQSLLETSAWMENPGPAIAEAMDVAVYLGQPKWIPVMAGLQLAGTPDALRHAGSIALERLVDLHPKAAIETLLDSPEGRRLDLRNRASLVARLDPVDPVSRNLLDGYLRSPQTSQAEAAAFLAYFPNLNLSLSHNLLSRPIPATDLPPHMERLQRAVEQVDGWLRDPALTALATDLETARKRLQQQIGGEPAP